MIPKKLHYCWFGRNPKPQLVQKCIESWKKYCPDWEIIEWNEDNYDISKSEFCKQAYENKKWAFVSDYARFDILNQYGGVYVDTDVEIIASIDEFLRHTLFSGYETDRWVAPGLILGGESGQDVLKSVLNAYDHAAFMENGTENHKTVGEFFTAALIEHGFVMNGQLAEIDGMALYPKEYFCPLDDSTGVMKKTKNTHTIHWYSKSWFDPKVRIKCKITRVFHRLFGTDCFRWLKK